MDVALRFFFFRIRVSPRQLKTKTHHPVATGVSFFHFPTSFRRFISFFSLSPLPFLNLNTFPLSWHFHFYSSSLFVRVLHHLIRNHVCSIPFFLLCMFLFFAGYCRFRRMTLKCWKMEEMQWYLSSLFLGFCYFWFLNAVKCSFSRLASAWHGFLLLDGWRFL